MSYQNKATWTAATLADWATGGSNKWTGQEIMDAIINMKDSVTWTDQEQTLTDAATVSWDCSLGYNAVVTLGGNRTLAISNAISGSFGTLTVIQDGTGGRTLTLPSGKTNGGFINTTAGAHSIIQFYLRGTSYYFSISQYS